MRLISKELKEAGCTPEEVKLLLDNKHRFPRFLNIKPSELSAIVKKPVKEVNHLLHKLVAYEQKEAQANKLNLRRG